jgi:hypothetical protein
MHRFANCWGALAIGFGIAVLALAGCPNRNAVPVTNGHGGHAHPEHEEGPHGGHLVKLDANYQAEWLHDDESGLVTVYILDGEAKEEVPIAADEVVIEVAVEGKTNRYPLPAAGRTLDQPLTARFETTDKALIVALQVGEGLKAVLIAEIDGKVVQGEIEHHPHDHGHGHKH